MAQIPSDSDLDPLEAALVKLRPAPAPIDRDRLMFQAGMMAARNGSRGTHHWVWPSIAASLALVVLSESMLLMSRPSPVVVVRQAASPPAAGSILSPVEVLVQSTPTDPESRRDWPSSESLSLRRQIYRFGLDGLPDLPPLVSRSDNGDAGPAGNSRLTEPLRRYEIDKFMNPGGPSS